VFRRRLLLSLLLVALALALVPTVLAAAGHAAPGDLSGGPAIRRTGDTRPLFIAPTLNAGARVASSVTVQNPGAVAGRYTLSAALDGTTRDVSVVVTRTADGAVLFSGPVSAAGAVDVGVLAPGAEARFSLEVVTAARDATAGRGMFVTFRWRVSPA
jgi:hypothetical protein